jgi:hypothetical protein
MEYDDFFKCKPDACGKFGFSSYKKYTAAIQMIACGVAGDLVDEYICMRESVCLDSMYKFYEAVVQIFGPEYLREPTVPNTQRMLSINEGRGFPRMLGSIDCMQ